MKNTKRANSSKIRHPMSAFGSLPSQIEKIRVNRLEERLIPQVPFPHKHDFFHILVFTQGKGWHEIDFVRHSVSRDSVFIMKPGQFHNWKLSADTQGYVIEFELTSLKSLKEELQRLRTDLFTFPDHVHYSKIEKQKILEPVKGVLREIEDQENGYEALIGFKLTEFLILLHRYLPKSLPKSSHTDQKSNEFLNLLESHFIEEHQVEFYAKKMGMTAKSFSMMISRSLGEAPRTLIQNRLVLEAKRILGYSANPIHQVADQLGFEDPNYFARFFKKATGLTPAGFRENFGS